MLFAQKNKGFFVELNDHAIMVARTSAPTAPLVVEEMRECPAGDPAALEALLLQMQPKVVVPGHGPLSENARQDLELTRDYLAYLREKMGAAARDIERDLRAGKISRHATGPASAQ